MSRSRGRLAVLLDPACLAGETGRSDEWAGSPAVGIDVAPADGERSRARHAERVADDRNRQPPSAGAHSRRTRGGPRRWRFVAAVVALAVSVSSLSFSVGLLTKVVLWPSDSFVDGEITTGSAESVTVTLTDNTAVRLGPSSTLRLIEGGDEPAVWLEGRAFFGVVPDPTRNFTVRTRYGDAMALGTRFEVRTDEREFRVLVVQGSVRVSSGGRSVELGERLISRNAQGGPPSASTVDDVHTELDWMGPALVFRATPLRRAISEIQHRYRVAVDLEDEALGDVTITATFTDQPVERVLFVVCEIVGAGCAVENGRFRIGDRSLGTLRPVPRPAFAPARTP